MKAVGLGCLLVGLSVAGNATGESAAAAESRATEGKSPGQAASGGTAEAVPPLTQGEEASRDERARELYLRGDRLYAESDYKGAIAAFRSAYDLSHRPLLLFNLANAYERSARYESAIEALRRYAPSAPQYEHEKIARRIRNLEKRISDADAKAAPKPVQPPEPPDEERELATSRGSETTGADSGMSQSGDYSQTGWILTIGGGALLATGGVATLIALNARTEAEDQCEGGICRAGAAEHIDTDQTASLIADIGVIGGSISLAAGLLLLLVFDEPEVGNHARVDISEDGFRLGYTAAF